MELVKNVGNQKDYANKKPGRNSSVELLRILCLVMIFWMHSAKSYMDNPVSAWISIAVEVVGNIGVSCFILISGYYGIRLDVRKMMRLDLMLILYSWIGLALQLIWGNSIGGEAILSYIFPVIGKQSWYFTCYFALAFLSPFLNEMVEKLGQMRLRQLLFTMLVIFSGITTVFFFDINEDGGKGIVHMVMMYLIGRYFGVYCGKKQYAAGKLLGTFLLAAGVNFCLNGALYLVTGTVQNRYARDCTLFTVVEAVCIFLLFQNIHFENNVINRAAKHVPGAFALEWTMRNLVLVYIMDCTEFAGEVWYEGLLFGMAVLLVLVGIVIDWLRETLLHGVEDWIVRHLYALGTNLCRRGKAFYRKRT